MRLTDKGFALRALQAGAIAVVLAAAPYKTFDLDRFFVPKELALGVTALVASLLCISRMRRLALSRVDELIALWLVLGVASALFATNWWLAGRAVALSVGGAACFWCARAVSRAGHSRALVAAFASTGAVGALTAMLQTYGLRTEFFSLNRAPGGTFGNRNFMAHLCVITLPAVLFSAVRAPTRASFLRWCAGLAVISGALVVSRTRAAWLALVVGLFVLLVASIFALRTRDDSLDLTRVIGALGAVAVGAALAMVIPNTLDWRSDSPYLDTATSIVNYKGGSGHGRLIQYGNSLKMSVRHPLLGVGPGNWPVVYPRFASDNDPSLGSDGMTSNPWPSSDWVTFLSERGLAALIVIGLALLGLTLDGLRAVRAGPTSEDRLSAAVLLSTLVILVTVGAFDAVLLLPVAALIGWGLIGSLSAPSRERRVIDLTWPKRVAAIVVVAAIGTLIVARSGAQLAAMSRYATSARTATLESASSLDPGSFRIHVRLAQLYQRRGDCKRSRVHASAAKALFPSAPAPKRLLAGC